MEGVEGGRWSIAAQELAFTAVASDAELVMAFEFEPELGLLAYFDAFSRPADEPMRLHAELVDGGGRSIALGPDAQVTAALHSDGVAIGALRLTDDGRQGDAVAGDGVYTAEVPRAAQGLLGAAVTVQGHTAERSPVAVWRTSAATALRPPPLGALGQSPARLDADPGDADYLRVRVPVAALDPAVTLPLEVAVSADLVVVDAGGDSQPLVGIRGLVDVVRDEAGQAVAELPVHRGWLLRSRAAREGAALELRDVSLQRGTDFAVVAAAARIPLANASAAANAAPALLGEDLARFDVTALAEPSLQMRTGQDPELDAGAEVQLAEPLLPRVLLVHGFCADDRFWPSGSPFDGVDLDGNEFARFQSNNVSGVPVLNREFAEEIGEFIDEQGFDEVNIIAHSQGAVSSALAASLFNLPVRDRAGRCGRGLQLVNGPWRGSGLADLAFSGLLPVRLVAELAAGLADEPRLACELRPTLSLTTAGAATTRGQLDPTIVRTAAVYRSGHPRLLDFNGWPQCNFLTSPLLAGRDDGIVTVRSQTLDGADNQALTNRRCHFTRDGFLGFYYGGIEESPGQNANLVARAVPPACGQGGGTTTDEPPPDSGGGGDNPGGCQPDGEGCPCETIFTAQLGEDRKGCAQDGGDPNSEACQRITPDGPFFPDKFCFGLDLTCGQDLMTGEPICRRCGPGGDEQVFGCACSLIGGGSVCQGSGGFCFGGQPGWSDPNGLGGICWSAANPPQHACLEDCSALRSPRDNSLPLVCITEGEGSPYLGVGTNVAYPGHEAHCASVQCGPPVANFCEGEFGAACGQDANGDDVCVSECLGDADCWALGYPADFYRCSNQGGGRCVF